VRAWWEGLAARERGLVAIGGALLVLLALYLAVVEPWLERRSALERQLQVLVDEEAWLRAQAPAVRALSAVAPGAGSPGGSPLAVVDATARSAGLGAALRRVRPIEQAVEAELEAAPWPALMRWLAALEGQHRIRVVSLSVDRGSEPGRVNAQLRLEPQGGR
jgi:general secretion pathway protein M